MAATREAADHPQPPVLPYGTAPRRITPKFVLRTLLAIGILLAGIALISLAIDLVYRPSPYRTMDVFWADIDGKACIESPHFTLLYEGYSFGKGIIRGGGYTVGGRSTAFVPWTYHDKPFVNGESPSIDYSERDCTLIMDYANTRVIYDDVGHRLTVGNRRYSTENGPVFLLIRRDGTVVEQRPSTSPAAK